MNYAPDPHLSKRLFVLSLISFLFLELYGVFHLEIRLCFESSFEIICGQVQGLSSPFYRYSFLLNKLLLSPAFAFHLPVKMIGYTLCINDLLFYLIVAGLIVALTRQYVYAAVVLAAPVLIHGHLYYFMVNEIFLSGSMMILYMAVYKQMQDGVLRKLILMVSIFFAIWGHPFTIYLTILFLLSIYESFDQIRKDWLIVSFIIINLCGRLTHWSWYDLERVHDHIQPLGGLTISLLQYLYKFTSTLVAYIIPHWFISLLLLVLMSTSSSTTDKRISRLALGSLLLVLFLQSILYFDKDGDGDNLAKLAYGTHLFILLYGSLALVRYFSQKTGVISLLTVLALALGIHHILFSDYRECIDKHILVLKKANYICSIQTPPYSKWYIKLKTVSNNDVLLNPFFFSETFTFSAFDKQKPQMHVVFASDSIIGLLQNTKPNEICFAYNLSYRADQLNSDYYPLITGPYKELIIDSAGFAKIKIPEQR